MKKTNIASIKIKNKKFYLRAVLDFLDTIAGNHTNIEFSRYNRLRYVVGEILEKRIENAYPGAEGLIEVEINLLENFLEVSIRDMGVPVWIDFSYNENPDMNNKTDMRNYILNRWIDRVGIEKLGKDGQRIYVSMEILNPLQFKAPEPYPETEVLDTNISIRPVETETDAIEAIRCIYSEYGYSYSYEKLYYIDSLMRMIKNRELMPFLAVNEHGQVAGHAALAFSDTFNNMPEISTVVVRKEFRGLGLFAKFMDFFMEMGEKQGFRAYMGQPVAFHPMSQKAFLKSGFTATAVLLSYIGSDIESEYNTNNQRLDLFSSVKILDKSAHSRVYPPAQLRPFVENVYDKLGWKYEIIEEASWKKVTEIRVETNSSMKTVNVLLRKASDDLEKTLQEIVKSAIGNKNDMIELLISLNDASCACSYDIAKKCKFVLSGVLPGGENDDYLVMQMLLGADVHYEHLVTVGEFEDLRKDIAALNSREE